jgi:DNA-formamidopyrimidine glycosylase
MPEGPEVTIIRENLNNYLEGFYLIEFTIFPTSRYINKTPDNLLSIKKSLPLKLESVNSKGKLIYWRFEKNFTLLNTLGMSGIWTKEFIANTSIRMNFILGKENRCIFFVDNRHFGTLKFLKNISDLEEKLKKIGPDILNEKKISFQDYKKRMIKYSHYNITKAMMDQKIISGIGNYLKSEILYNAKISPLRKVEDLEEKELYNLYNSSKKIINKSYKNGGVSIRDFEDIDRKKGRYQFKLEVYCKKEDKNGFEIERISTPDKRTTYWVPKIQI